MNADYPFAKLTERIIAAAYSVHNTLGAEFLESVYTNALQMELRLTGLDAALEVPIIVRYREYVVGEFRADMIVSNEVIVEIKAVTALTSIHDAQLVNYLIATGRSIGLLINFGRSVQVRRKIYSKNLRESAKSAKSA